MKNNKKAQVIQGRWHKINKKIKKRITAKYHKIKDWVIDPKGYFLIDIDREKKLLNVGYCKIRIFQELHQNFRCALSRNKVDHRKYYEHPQIFLPMLMQKHSPN